MIVEIRRRRPEDGGIEVLGRVVAAEAKGGGPARVEPADDEAGALIAALLAPGVVGPDGRRLVLADGLAFVAALPDAIRGSRFWAERVGAQGDGPSGR